MLLRGGTHIAGISEGVLRHRQQIAIDEQTALKRYSKTQNTGLIVGLFVILINWGKKQTWLTFYQMHSIFLSLDYELCNYCLSCVYFAQSPPSSCRSLQPLLTSLRLHFWGNVQTCHSPPDAFHQSWSPDTLLLTCWQACLLWSHRSFSVYHQLTSRFTFKAFLVYLDPCAWYLLLMSVYEPPPALAPMDLFSCLGWLLMAGSFKHII